MPASDQHPLYVKNKDRWQIVRDCVEGSECVKNARTTTEPDNGSLGLHNVSGAKYLPPPNPGENTQENRDRYHAYKTRANFVNFTGHTKDGFMGMIGRKPSIIELDSSIDYMVDSSDGGGQSLQELIQHNIGELQETGRNGLLVDYPISEAGLTELETQDIKAVIKEYPAESIVNWQSKSVMGINKLTMVVLAEDAEKETHDGFSFECVTYHRVLFLEDGVYKQNVYDEDDNLVFFEDEDGEPNPDLVPRKSDGSLWDEIPFCFSGAVTNTPEPDKAPLYDIAEINISHYRNSADYEESSFMVGQPTPVLAGLTQAWVDEVLKNGVGLGSRKGILLPEGANAQLLQANPNQMPSTGMEIKEAQMIKIGAKIITDSSGVETAEAAKIRFSGQNSKLGLIVMNTEKAILKCLGWVMEFMGGSGENVVEINKQFYENTVNPQLLVANMQLLDKGIIAKADIRDQMRKSGQIASDRTDEDIDVEIENISPLI